MDGNARYPAQGFVDKSGPLFDVLGRTGEEDGMSEHLVEHRASVEEWSYTTNGTALSHWVFFRLCLDCISTRMSRRPVECP